MQKHNDNLTNKGFDGYNKREIRCDCGKIVAVEQNGYVYVKCKTCKRQVAIIKIQS